MKDLCVGRCNCKATIIVKLIDFWKPKKLFQISIILRFSTLPVGLFVIFLTQRIKNISLPLLFSYVLIFFWMSIAPYLIWLYELNLLPSFFKCGKKLFTDTEEFKAIYQKYLSLFVSKRNLIIILFPWCAFLLLGWFKSFPILIAQGGFKGYKDPWLLLGTVAVLWVGFLSSQGILGVVTTLGLIRALSISEIPIALDPFHPDKLGGLSCFGRYAIGTTLFLSSGSFFLPFAFQVLNKDNSLLVYIGTFLIMMLILISFLYPTILINRKAKRFRDKILLTISSKINRTYSELVENENHVNEKKKLYLEILKDFYNTYQQMSLYPFEIEILAKLVSSVILPLIFLLIQHYWLT
jgi:hypothetical protein